MERDVASREAGFSRTAQLRELLRAHIRAALPGAVAVGLMLVWAEHDGGYDQDTWYWGALVLLAVLAASTAASGCRRVAAPARWAITLFAVYVLWSYASIAWAGAPGTSLDGSNRALLYLIVFSLFVILPWTAEGALAMLVTFALGVGAIALEIAYKLASGARVVQLFDQGRLIAPTGYFNSSVALFTTAALGATALAVRRELPAPIRGLLIASACLDVQLALIGQSRGWLFTLPFVSICWIALVRNRIRVAIAASIPIAATLVPIHAFLNAFQPTSTAALGRAAMHAGRVSVVSFGMAFALGTVIGWSEDLIPRPQMSARLRRRIGAVLAVLALAGGTFGVLLATHDRPLQFVERQWDGFEHEQSGGISSNFGAVGSGRYDFWRVALDAFIAQPIGGLGQDNFDNYYVIHRHTGEEPAWPHSLELRLLAMTGIVGFALFAGFIMIAVREALRGVRATDARQRLRPAVCAAALIPLVDWLLHGSVDWFWEIPALSGPALGFLGMAVALGRPDAIPSAAAHSPAIGEVPHLRIVNKRARRRGVGITIGAVTLVLATIVLGFSYLSVREVSSAGDLRSTDPQAALNDLTLAAELNPLSADPGRIGGTIALENGLFGEAERRYQQSIDRDPQGWLALFGKGLAASALGDRVTAARALRLAVSINGRQPAIRLALARVDTPNPLNPVQALSLLVAPG